VLPDADLSLIGTSIDERLVLLDYRVRGFIGSDTATELRWPRWRNGVAEEEARLVKRDEQSRREQARRSVELGLLRDQMHPMAIGMAGGELESTLLRLEAYRAGFEHTAHTAAGDRTDHVMARLRAPDRVRIERDRHASVALPIDGHGRSEPLRPIRNRARLIVWHHPFSLSSRSCRSATSISPTSHRRDRLGPLA
jgi:hypothetical protein